MKLVPILCNHCGASLKIQEDTRFVTCDHCSSTLRVVHEGASWFTEVIQKLEEKTADIEDEMEIMKLEQQLERLRAAQRLEDMENNYGRSVYPGAAYFILILSIVFAILFAFIPSLGTLLGMSGNTHYFIAIAIVFFGVVLFYIMRQLELHHQDSEDLAMEQRRRIAQKINDIRAKAAARKQNDKKD